MRLQPHEVRIVNAVRGIRQGQVTIHKHEDGQIAVNTASKEPSPGAIVKQAESGPEKIDRLRG